MASSSTSSIGPVNWLSLRTPQNPPLNMQEGIDALVNKINEDWIIALDLSGQHMGEAHAKDLARKLRNNHTLISLNLSENDISETGVKEIYKILFAKQEKRISEDPNHTLIYLKIDNYPPIKKLHNSHAILKQIIAFVDFIHKNEEDDIPSKFLGLPGQSFIELEKDSPGGMNISNYYEYTPLIHIAASVGNVRVLQFFIDKQPTIVNLGNKFFNTPLQMSVRAGKENTTKLLIQSGARLDYSREITPLNPGPPLYIALVHQPVMLEMILETARKNHSMFNIDIEIHGSSKPTTLLLEAIRRNNIAAIRLLLDHGANVSRFTDSDLDPFCNILRWWNEELSKIIERHISDESTTNDSTETPLSSSTSSSVSLSNPKKIGRKSRKEVLSSEWDSSIEPYMNDLQKTPLYPEDHTNNHPTESSTSEEAINNKYQNILLELLKVDGINLNYQLPETAEGHKQRNGGYTLLHMAVASGQTELVKQLVARRANPELKDNAGMTPLDLARQKRFNASEELQPEQIRLYHQICRTLENPEEINESASLTVPAGSSYASADDLEKVIEEITIAFTESKKLDVYPKNPLELIKQTSISRDEEIVIESASYCELRDQFDNLLQQCSELLLNLKATLEVDSSYQRKFPLSGSQPTFYALSLSLPHLIRLCDTVEKLIENINKSKQLINHKLLHFAKRKQDAFTEIIQSYNLRNDSDSQLNIARNTFTALDRFISTFSSLNFEYLTNQEKYTVLRNKIIQILHFRLEEQYEQLIKQTPSPKVESQIDYLLSIWTNPIIKSCSEKTALDIILEMRSKKKNESVIKHYDKIITALIEMTRVPISSSSSLSSEIETANAALADKILGLITPLIAPLCSDKVEHQALLELLEKIVEEINVNADNKELSSLLDEAARMGTPAIIDTLIVKDRSLSVEKLERLISLAIESGHAETIEYLIYLGTNLYGEDFFRKNATSQQLANSLRSEVQELKGEFDRRIERLEVKHEAFKAETEAKMNEFSQVLNLELRRKIQSFFDRPHEGEYFKIFYNTFCFIIATEFEGMRGALSHWLTITNPTSVQVINFLTALSKESPFPGTSLAASVLALIPKKLAENGMINRITAVAKSFAFLGDTQNFIQTLCYHMMEILQNHIILLDKKHAHEGYEVDRDAIDQLARSLFSRIVLYMFTLDAELPDDPLNHSAQSLSEQAEGIAASIIWFKTNKLAQIEYLKENPFVNCGITILPTRRELSVAQQAKAKIRGAGRKIKKLPHYLSNRGHADQPFIHLGQNLGRKLYTDNGMFCKSPVRVGTTYYEPTGCRPEDYADLIVSERGFALIQAMTHTQNENRGLLIASTRPNRETIRLTRCYRELFLEQTPITATVPLHPAPEVVAEAAPHLQHDDHHWVRKDSLNEFWEKKARAVIQHETKAITRKIKKFSKYPQEGRKEKYDAIKERIDDLNMLGENAANIIALHKQSDEEYNKIIGNGSGAGSSE